MLLNVFWMLNKITILLGKVRSSTNSGIQGDSQKVRQGIVKFRGFQMSKKAKICIQIFFKSNILTGTAISRSTSAFFSSISEETFQFRSITQKFFLIH